MKPRVVLALGAVGSAVLALVACGSGAATNGTSTKASSTSSTSGGGGLPGFGGSGGGSGGSVDAGFDAASGPHATVRIADFAKPDLLYLDVCLSTDALGASTTWSGPVLRGTYGSISNSTMTPYFPVVAGTRSVRFVLLDSPDCTQTLAGLPDFALAAPLTEGQRATLLFLGTGFDAGGRPLEIVTLNDEAVPDDAGNRARFVNAAQAEGAIDIYTYSGFGKKAPCSRIFSDIAYGAAGAAVSLPGDGGPTDSNGYAPLRGENLYQLTFSSLAYTVHGTPCSGAFGGLYSTDGYLGQGAWTVFVHDEDSMSLMCEDDGTANPFCTRY